MKTVFLTIVMVLTLVSSVGAWSLTWGGSVGAIGYKIYYHELDNPSNITEVDVGNVLVLNLDNEELIKGTRYEFWCTAYNTVDESGHSNHLRWTYPIDPIIIETLIPPITLKIVIEAQ